MYGYVACDVKPLMGASDVSGVLRLLWRCGVDDAEALQDGNRCETGIGGNKGELSIQRCPRSQSTCQLNRIETPQRMGRGLPVLITWRGSQGEDAR